MLTIIGVGHFATVFGQQGNIAFSHLTVEEGLSQSTVFSITQDTKGFIWIGTRDGLNRYDSHEVKVYKNKDNDTTSLIYNSVNSLLIDSKGQLWVGTYQGVCIYRPESDNFTRITYNPKNPWSLSNNNVNIIFEDKDKNIWIGTRGGLSLVQSQHPLRMINFLHDPKNPESLADNYVRAIHQDTYGDLWVGTSNGLSRIRKDKQKGYRVTTQNVLKNIKNPLSNNWINAIAEEDHGTLWIGTEKGGLYIFDPGTNEFYTRRNHGQNPFYQSVVSKIDESVRVVERDKDGQFWIGTMRGLYIVNPVTYSIKESSSNPDNPASLSDNSVRAIFIDRDNSKWIGTYNGGVSFYSPRSNQFDHFKQIGKNSPLRSRIASALVEDYKHNLWLSVDGFGIIHWDRTNDKFQVYRHETDDPSSLSHDNVKCICPDGHEGLWFGTFNGLNYFSFSTGKFT
ncbi:MAG TPA: two-component regulator propeller domain-containing protein, partial [Bacteroidales bacterium]